ncbi:zinc finger protein 831 [Betta splendens]|uniref:Zinc finger protein 831 n=1 Tax=Betta splendens TaxID=158456 RepID=A0A6P7MKI0_BETSP|nr:zinc finger protein 831 [Betta splendens]XP_055365030.1 zinc finger protein 831 [Betta splendens]
METGKPGLVSAPVHIGAVAAQTEKRMDIQAPLRAVYIHTVPAVPAQPPAAVREPAMLHLAVPSLYSNETLPFLTLHIAGGLQPQPGLSAAAGAPASRPKSAGKHVCPHCGRDCMKPSVLEKHLRCHTGERPYPCATCGVSFKTQSNLYKHKRTQAHARLSCESEQSSLGSVDSMSSSRDTCSSSLSLDEDDIRHTTKEQDSMGEQNELAAAAHKTQSNGRVEDQSEIAPSGLGRHLHLQRQEATLFSKQWENSVSSGKSQSHESTDSGFSESNDHYLSPVSVLPHSLTKSKERLEETTSTNAPSEPEPRDPARVQEQKTLEERISKLISENTAVVEDKQLDNVRPRKTVLSKQGSIDLPMPYTYKDSFHFDMKIGKTQSVGLHRLRAPALHSSVPTQRSCSAEHAPLTRSNSLPFSVALLQPESPASSHHRDYVSLARRGSSGQSAPAAQMRPVAQHSAAHRPLVRQAAVDCNHAADAHFMNSSVEEACDGDGGDAGAEPSSRKSKRKKAQKFAYNKWYMYGGGTFKKLYSPEKGGESAVIKGRSHEVIQRSPAAHKDATADTSSSGAALCLPGCPPLKPPSASALTFDLKASQLHPSATPLKAPLRRNLSLSVLPLSSVGSFLGLKTSSTDAGAVINGGSASQLCGAHVPSDRKKQKTHDQSAFPLMDAARSSVTHPLPSVAGVGPQQETSVSSVSFPENQIRTQVKEAVFLPRIISANVASVGASPETSVSSTAKTSFLPKYQLKLPNASDTESPVMDKPSGTVHTFTSVPPPSTSEHNSVLGAPSETSCEELSFSSLSQTPDINKTKASSSTQTQFIPPSKTTLCPAQTSALCENVTSLPGATTMTTTCLKNKQAGICSTWIHPSASAASSAPVQVPTHAAPVAANVPGRCTVTSATDTTGQAAPHRPPAHPQPAANPGSGAYAGQRTPLRPCDVVPFNQEQPVSQNVFHVHTADLQICLQIISDEQLALIEPQIEREAPGGIQSKAPNSTVSDDHQPPRQPRETSHAGKVQPNIHLSERSTSSPADPKPPDALGWTLRPHRNSNAHAESSSSGGDVITAASLRGVDPGKHQTADGEHDRHPAGEQSSLDRTLAQTPSLSKSCSAPSIGSLLLVKEANRLEPRETPWSLQGVSASPSASGCAHTVSRQLKAQVSAHDSDPLCKPADRGCDRVGPFHDPAPLQEITPGEAEGLIGLAQEQLGLITAASSKSQVEIPRDEPAVLSSVQSAAAGVTQAASPVARAGQTEPQDPGHAAGSRCRLRPRPDARDTRSTTDRGTGTDQGETLKVKEESLKSSWLTEQHRTQTHSGMSEHPPQSPQHPSSPRPPPETNSQQTQTPGQSKEGKQTPAQAQITGGWTESSHTSSSTDTGRPWPPHDYASHVPDPNSKYQAFFLTGQFHSFQPGECLNNGVRAVLSCPDAEDTSSSDEEGKLIIEL